MFTKKPPEIKHCVRHLLVSCVFLTYLPDPAEVHCHLCPCLLLCCSGSTDLLICGHLGRRWRWNHRGKLQQKLPVGYFARLKEIVEVSFVYSTMYSQRQSLLTQHSLNLDSFITNSELRITIKLFNSGRDFWCGSVPHFLLLKSRAIKGFMCKGFELLGCCVGGVSL